MDDSGFGFTENDAHRPVDPADYPDSVVHSEPVGDTEWDLRRVPRTTLHAILNEYDPISVGNQNGHEYIVVAPKGSVFREDDLDDRAPSTTLNVRGPVTTVTAELAYVEELGRQFAARGMPKPSREQLRAAGVLPGGNSANSMDHWNSLAPLGSGAGAPAGNMPYPTRDSSTTRVGIGGTTGQVREHDIVSYARGVGVDESSMTTELGSAVASPWTAWTRREYNADLYGYKGLRIYDKMRKSDGTVRGTLRLAKTPVLSAKWGMKPASDSTRDKKIAGVVWRNLIKYQSMSWPQLLTEALLMLDFGYYMFENVWEYAENIPAARQDPDARGRLLWKKFAPRHPMDVKEWFFDINGGPLSVDMWAPPATGIPTLEGGVIQAFQRWINIPIDKLVVFSFDKEAGNIEGISILRSAYKHWYYKDNLYKIDAIQKERHGIGIPVIVLPMGYSVQDRLLADQLGRNLRTNDRAHVVLPPNWTLTFAELHGHPVDAIASIKHHDDMIPQGILGQFMNTQRTDIEEQHTIFLKATRFTADIVVDVVNKYATPQLVDLNWARAGYPELYAKQIGEQEDWRTESFTIRNYVGAGVIVPDDELENAIRDHMGLPPADPNTARITRTPPQENPQKIQPAPSEESGPHHVVVPAQMPGAPPTPNQPKPGAPAPPSTPRVGLPRQGKPGTVKPSTGGGDGSGSSGRRGQ